VSRPVKPPDTRNTPLIMMLSVRRYGAFMINGV